MALTEPRPESGTILFRSPVALVQMHSPPSSLIFSLTVFFPHSTHSTYLGNHESFFPGVQLTPETLICWQKLERGHLIQCHLLWELSSKPYKNFFLAK